MCRAQITIVEVVNNLELASSYYRAEMNIRVSSLNGKRSECPKSLNKPTYYKMFNLCWNYINLITEIPLICS